MHRRWRQRVVSPLLLLGALSLSGCVDDEPAVDMTTGALFDPVSVHFAPTETALDRRRYVHRVDLASLRDLWIRVRGLPLWPVVRIEATMFAPSGDAFRVEQVWFAASRTVTSITVPDVSHPVAVRWPKLVDYAFAFDFPVAVLGTDLLRVPQPGRWTVSIKASTWFVAVEATLNVEVR